MCSECIATRRSPATYLSNFLLEDHCQYDISKDRSSVAAWFVRKGAMGPGTRRPQKGAGAGVNRPWHKQLQKARNMGAEQAFEFKKLSSDLYVPRWKRVKVEPNADAAPDESYDRSISPSLSI